MKRAVPIIIFTLVSLLVPVAYAEPQLSITFSPETQYGQVWAYETYQVNVSLQGLNFSQIDLSGYALDPSGLYFVGEVKWRGKGGYDFGGATLGYNRDLRQINIDQEVLLDESFIFNLMLEKDAYEFGMLPFETIEVTFGFDVYLVMSDDSLGPRIASKSSTFTLVDEMKVSYLEGKYIDMQDEINAAINASGLTTFNRQRYQGILDEMNNSLVMGNYVNALDIWDDYDEDDRIDLILGLIRASEVQYEELSRVQELEDQIEALEDQMAEAETQIQILELEYEQLDNTYNTLSNTYRKVNAELDLAKRNVTTAITAVFLTAIVFFFLGRRDRKREE